MINSGSWVGKSGDIVLLEDKRAEICSFDFDSGKPRVREEEIELE